MVTSGCPRCLLTPPLFHTRPEKAVALSARTTAPTHAWSAACPQHGHILLRSFPTYAYRTQPLTSRTIRGKEALQGVVQSTLGGPRAGLTWHVWLLHKQQPDGQSVGLCWWLWHTLSVHMCVMPPCGALLCRWWRNGAQELTALVLCLSRGCWAQGRCFAESAGKQPRADTSEGPEAGACFQ